MQAAPPPGRRGAAVLTVPPAADSVRRVRTLARAVLDGAGVARDTVETALLLLSELVTNAVLHARTDVEVRMSVSGDVRMSVHDDGPGVPAHRAHPVDSMTGRGLQIVEMLADDFGVDATSDRGKTVWFALAGRGSRPGPSAPEPARPAPPGALPAQDPPLRLCGLPVLLFEVLTEYDEALLRELLLHQLDLPPSGPGAAQPAIVAAEPGRARIVAAVRTARWQHPDAEVLDVDVRVSEGDIRALRGLLPVIQEARRLARSGQILTRPALPELRQLRDWLVLELHRQSTGALPTPWRGSLADDITPPSGGGTAEVREAVTGVRAEPAAALVLADGEDRILAASTTALALLGWTWEKLIGRRVSAVVPPDQRDRHVAGFTRHAMTGRQRLLGVTTRVSAWHRDGYAVPVDLTLDRWPRARSLYLARLDAVPPPDPPSR